MSDVEDRLRALRVEISNETREAHLLQVRRELARHRSRSMPRRRVVAALVGALLVLQVGVVWAAEDALPGDPLYGVKVAYEAPRSLFDPDVRLRHRLEEAERLRDSSPAVTDDLVRDATDLTTPKTDTDLRRRLDGLRDRDRTAPPTTQPRPDVTAPPSDRASTTTEAVRDRPGPTTTSEAARDGAGSATTTTAGRQRDEATTTTAPAGDVGDSDK